MRQRQMDPGGERDYIDGIAIHAGDYIRVFHDGRWQDARYEANWHRGRIEWAWAYLSESVAVPITAETLVELPS